MQLAKLGGIQLLKYFVHAVDNIAGSKKVVREAREFCLEVRILVNI